MVNFKLHVLAGAVEVRECVLLLLLLQEWISSEEHGLSAVTARVEPVWSCRHTKSLKPTKPLNQSVSPGDKICNLKHSDTNTVAHVRAFT